MVAFHLSLIPWKNDKCLPHDNQWCRAWIEVASKTFPRKPLQVTGVYATSVCLSVSSLVGNGSEVCFKSFQHIQGQSDPRRYFFQAF
jgi:hypothetical protein